MARKKIKRKPGPPARYGRRPTLTIRLQEPLYRTIKKSAAEHGKSISEEIEGRLEMTKAALDAAFIQAIRAAGWQIVREAGGKVTVNMSPELLLAEADGILRSGFIAPEDVDKSPLEIVAEKTAERIESLLVEAGLLRRKGVA
jgi:hypothetical protein